jgi:glycosyltransferase involved in cell wall biosynthesis
MNTLSVVIPALDEEDGIADIIERVLSIKEPLADVGVNDLELIVVDDGSTDRTPEIVSSYPGATLLKHPVNKGYGAAIKTGFRHARGNLLSFLDADGTYPPEYYPQLCRPIVEDRADLVVGSRMAGADTDMPLTRRIGNTIFATLVSIISNRKVTDSASGQRVLRSDILPHLYPLPDGLNFTPVMSTKAMHEDIKVVEIPIPYSERVGPSKLSVVHDGIRFLNTILMTALTYNPARIFGLAGLTLAGLGLLIGILSLLLGGYSAKPDGQFAALFAGLVLIAAGINVFAIGTAFNYLVSLFHKRRIRQGLFGRPIFNIPLERRFGWLGLVTMMGGGLVYGAAVWQNWTTPASTAPWFAPAVSTVMVLTGLQLLTSWLLVIVLAELSEREVKAEVDLEGATPVTSQKKEKAQAVEAAAPLAGLSTQ